MTDNLDKGTSQTPFDLIYVPGVQVPFGDKLAEQTDELNIGEGSVVYPNDNTDIDCRDPHVITPFVSEEISSPIQRIHPSLQEFIQERESKIPTVPFRDRVKNAIGEIVGLAKTDIEASDHKKQTVAKGVGALIMQGLDRSRMSLWLVPTIAIHTLKHSHNALETAAVAATAFEIWCGAVAVSLDLGIREFKSTIRRLPEKFPRATQFLGEVVPGIERKKDLMDEKRSFPSRIKHSVATNAARGNTTLGIGPTLYVLNAHLQEWDNKEVVELYAKANIDGGIAVAGVAGILGEIIIKTYQHNPQVAKDILNVIGHNYTFPAAATTGMTLGFIYKQIKKKIAAKQEKEIGSDLVTNTPEA